MRLKNERKQIAITTMTFYPRWYRGKLSSIKHTDKVRGDLAIEFLNKATKDGYQVIVADGKSSKSFRKTILKIPNLILIKRKSHNRSLAKKQTLLKASKLTNIKVIVISEPEKVSLLSCIDKITLPILENKAEIVIPNRNQILFEETYPKYQYESETEGNILYNQILKTNGLLSKQHEDFDIFFGPSCFANKKNIISLFNHGYNLKIDHSKNLRLFLNSDLYSNSLYMPIVLALKKRLRVISLPVDFSYPRAQKDNEDRGSKELFIEKRKNQKMSILIELLYFINYLKTK